MNYYTINAEPMFKKFKQFAKAKKVVEVLKTETEDYLKTVLEGYTYGRDSYHLQKIENGNVYFYKHYYVGCGEYETQDYKMTKSDFLKLLSRELELTDNFKN